MQVKINEQKISVIGKIRNPRVSFVKGGVSVEWEFPVISTPENYAMEVHIDVLAVFPSGKTKKFSSSPLKFLLVPKEKGKHRLYFKPRIFCVENVEGPTTEISFII